MRYNILICAMIQLHQSKSVHRFVTSIFQTKKVIIIANHEMYSEISRQILPFCALHLKI